MQSNGTIVTTSSVKNENHCMNSRYGLGTSDPPMLVWVVFKIEMICMRDTAAVSLSICSLSRSMFCS